MMGTDDGLDDRDNEGSDDGLMMELMRGELN